MSTRRRILRDGWQQKRSAARCLVLAFGLCASLLIPAFAHAQGSTSLTPEERLALASNRVDDGKRRIEEARQMIVEGKNMRNNGAREAKRHQKELNRVTSEHEKEINRLSRKLKSDERSARAEARQAITSQRNNFREESREVKANLRAAIREQKKGERLIVRGKRKLETAKQFLSRAQDKERDLIKANHEREKRMAERERKRG